MPPCPSRRSLLGSVALGAVSGCLSDLGLGGTDGTEECDVQTGRWRGEAEPISTTVETQQTEDIEEYCRDEAAEAVFADLTERTDIGIEGQDWITYGSSYDGEYTVVVWVKSVTDRDGNVDACPDAAFDRSEMRAGLPSEVTVTLEPGGSGESHECTYPVELRIEEVHLD